MCITAPCSLGMANNEGCMEGSGGEGRCYCKSIVQFTCVQLAVRYATVPVNGGRVSVGVVVLELVRLDDAQLDASARLRSRVGTSTVRDDGTQLRYCNNFCWHITVFDSYSVS